MADININTVNKYYGDVHVIKDVSLDIKSQSFTVLVGPSGCGKSTMLRMIAGLEDINSGTVSIDGQVVNDLPPKLRNIAMVFQSYALYPHMTVFDNMAFGLKLENYPSSFGSLLNNQASTIQLTTDAIINKSKHSVYLALLADPIVDNAKSAERLIETMISFQKDYLGYLN